MTNVESLTAECTRLGSGKANGIVVAGLLGAAYILSWLDTSRPSILPYWAPWEFSWVQFLIIWLATWWYICGLALSLADDHPSIARQISFFAGIFIIYAVVQTRFVYLAEHMFFLNRVQHICMHHLGPMLIALAWPGITIKRGMPARLRRLAEHPFIGVSVKVIQHPVPATFLFVGLVAFWLIPSVHFRAMVDPNLYAIMNWSMVLDGILFWCLVLDPRSKPPARVSFGTRAALVTVVMFPQIILGAIIAMTAHDLYPYYDLCGRIYPAIDAGSDQALGGLIIWIPAAMMSVIGLLLVINGLRRVEEAQKDDDDEDSACAMAIHASSWTGR